MWTCNNCGEKGEDNFETCWNCNADRDDSAPLSERASSASKRAARDFGTKREILSRNRTRPAPNSSANSKLTPCPDCGNSCSTLALSCPKCGRPLNAAESQETSSLVSEVEKIKDEQAESQQEKAARERAERIANIPVTSRVVSYGGESQRAVNDENQQPLTGRQKIHITLLMAIFLVGLVVLVLSVENKNAPTSSYSNYNESTSLNSNLSQRAVSSPAYNSNYQRTQPGYDANAPLTPRYKGDIEPLYNEVQRRKKQQGISDEEAVKQILREKGEIP